MISDISLQNFRSYIDDSFEFSSDVNIIVGPNASGKTNLLEAILVSCLGGSYRAKDYELIRFKSPMARIEAHGENSMRVVMIERGDDKTDKSYSINTQKYRRLKLDQTIPIVLFEPNHLLLLIGSPELRRNFIDGILEQSITGFKTLKSRYRRTLLQRNKLLKESSLNISEMFVWNVRLSELAGQIFKQRNILIDQINSEISVIYDSISGGKEKLRLDYISNCSNTNYESNLISKLEGSIETDRMRGFTSFGPHKDDIGFFISDKPAAEVASRGETRTILLALKIIESQVLERERGQKPILLFDDVFSELDGSRRLALTKTLKGHQAFITTTDADIVVQHFTQTASITALVK